MTREIEEDEFYGRIDKNLPPDPIGGLLEKPNVARVRSQLPKFSLEELFARAAAFKANPYDDRARLEFFVLNEAFSARGIAPAWRKFPKHRCTPGGSPSPSEARYALDLQMVDLQWIYTMRKGHKSREDSWGGIFGKIFATESFNYEQANAIACTQFTAKEKIKHLRLPGYMQRDLNILRGSTIRMRCRRAAEGSEGASIDLEEAAAMNSRRGAKTANQIPEWKVIWYCRALIGDSSDRIAAMYRKITGREINSSTLRKKINRIESALKEVGSDFSLGPFGTRPIKRDRAQNPKITDSDQVK